MEDRNRIWRILLNILIPTAEILAVCVLGPWLLRFFMPFIVGWIIAMIANPLVRFLEKHLKIVRKHSSVVIVVAVLALVIGIIYLALSRLTADTVGLLKDLPQIIKSSREEIGHAMESLLGFLEILPDGVREAASQRLARIDENLGSAVGSLMEGIAFPTVTAAGNVAKGIPAALVYAVVVILSSYFFIVERERILDSLHRVVPAGIWDYMDFLKRDMLRLMGGYFLAQFRIMFVVAVILTVGFLILGIRHAVFLAVLTAALDFLPVLGTGTVLFPWAFVKLLSGEWSFALGLVFLYLLTQAARQVIQPKIMGDSMGIPPLTTLLLLYMGFRISGISGMILAVPMGIIILNLYHYGVFDSLIHNIKLLAEEAEHFRKGK